MIQALKLYSAHKHSTSKTDRTRKKEEKAEVRCAIVTMRHPLLTLRTESSERRLGESVLGHCREINLRGMENRTQA